MHAHRHLEVSDSQGVTSVRLLDRQMTDGTGIENLGLELYRLIESEHRNKFLLDFSLVHFLTSSALGKLIALNRRLAARNGQMKLCCICPEIRRVFAMTKLDGVFDIEVNAADAFAALVDVPINDLPA